MLSSISIKEVKRKFKNYNRFQIACVFAEYNLLKSTTFKQNFKYRDFRIILIQFYISFSRHEHQVDVLYVSFNS